ncbi:hypothetical protein [Limnoglobus roseus]|uniref:hypothetical protein n=1 Tax=Limnoglobus roseus TaxID=2598579 RepID=UPI001FE892B4|nr:hypothetical protein [Limnoglobus roseus]
MGKEPGRMLSQSGVTFSPRKLRLFAVECCKAITNLLDDRGRRALVIAEQFADGFASPTLLLQGEQLATEAYNEFHGVQEFAAEAVIDACVSEDVSANVLRVAWLTANLLDVGIERPLKKATKRLGRIRQSEHLRDIFGNPFRPIALEPAWLTPTAVGIAQGIYNDRAFDRLPILADALQDAGCEDANILAHCRVDGPHVRGCWVVDLVLGKE